MHNLGAEQMAINALRKDLREAHKLIAELRAHPANPRAITIVPHDHCRLGQTIVNALLGDGPRERDISHQLFAISDAELIRLVEEVRPQNAQPAEERRLGIPHQRIRTIVRNLKINLTDADVRAAIRCKCDPKIWPAELLVKAEDYAVEYYRRMVGR